MPWLSQLLLMMMVVGAWSLDRMPRGDNVFEGTHRQDIVAFYNVYAEGNYYKDIVRYQLSRMDANHLFDYLEVVYYATSGRGADKYTIDHPKFNHIAHHGDTGEEVQTLALLYDFCIVNPQAKVLYFHDKGSFHYNYNNVKFRTLMDCYVLNPSCIETLDHHDICGWRVTPHPFIHFSGNFWWARCKYINRLVDPMSPVYNETFIELTKTLNDCVGAKGRYFAESWIGSAPTVHPADCMNETIDTSYLWGYAFPPAADRFCPGVGLPSGLPCGTAATYVNLRAFMPAINHMTSLEPSQCQKNDAEVTKRTKRWYGAKPDTYLEWMQSMIKAVPTPDGMLIRFSDSTQIYIAQNGTLRGFPNSKTFFAKGLDFGNVKTILANDRPAYKIGKMLPSA